jgi:hypothetical protein
MGRITDMGRGIRTGLGLNRECGATVVEFVVIIIFCLLPLIFGILEYAFIFYQEHFIANAAREGMRVGIRADNFNCFDGKPAAGCTANLDRKKAVENDVRDYLAAIYNPADIQEIDVRRLPAELAPGETPPPDKSLKVTVTVNNFFPPLLSALIPGIKDQTTLSYTTTGRYEDPDEYDQEDFK